MLETKKFCIKMFFIVILFCLIGRTGQNKTQFPILNITSTREELVETKCHVATETLVATASATVSSAFDQLCHTDRMVNEIRKLERRLSRDLTLLRGVVTSVQTKLFSVEHLLAKTINST